MANGKCETLRDGETSVFLCEPETFDFLDCETETSKCLTPSYKKRDCETHITAQKTRLRDPWNSTKILRDPEFLMNHSPPLPLLRCFHTKTTSWTIYIYCNSYKEFQAKLPFVSGLIVLPRTNVFPAARESSKEATKSANTSAASASCFYNRKLPQFYSTKLPAWICTLLWISGITPECFNLIWRVTLWLLVSEIKVIIKSWLRELHVRHHCITAASQIQRRQDKETDCSQRQSECSFLYGFYHCYGRGRCHS